MCVCINTSSTDLQSENTTVYSPLHSFLLHLCVYLHLLLETQHLHMSRSEAFGSVTVIHEHDTVETQGGDIDLLISFFSILRL